MKFGKITLLVLFALLASCVYVSFNYIKDSIKTMVMAIYHNDVSEAVSIVRNGKMVLVYYELALLVSLSMTVIYSCYKVFMALRLRKKKSKLHD